MGSIYIVNISICIVIRVAVMHVCASVCVHTCVRAHVRECACMCVRAYVHICIYVCVCVYDMCVCMYIVGTHSRKMIGEDITGVDDSKKAPITVPFPKKIRIRSHGAKKRVSMPQQRGRTEYMKIGIYVFIYIYIYMYIYIGKMKYR